MDTGKRHCGLHEPLRFAVFIFRFYTINTLRLAKVFEPIQQAKTAPPRPFE
jgi:hypothetical protein